MRRKQDRPKVVNIQFHRLKACLAIARRPVQDFCRALPVSSRHAQFVLTGERTGSTALLAAIRRELGEPAWAFATGQIDTLCDDAPTVEAQP